ncbi:MAG: PEP-CTERM sorting domain-containing protein [Aquabacterium sp.]
MNRSTPLPRFLSWTAASAAAVATLLASPATQAAPFSYSTDFSAGIGAEWTLNTSFNSGQAGILGQLADGAATLAVDGQAGGSSSLDFDLLGFRTIDGYNCCTDRFRLYLNGVEVFRGVFAMGGGGGEGVELNSLGAVVSGGGMMRHIAIGSFALAAGVNTLRFDYGALQGFGDEAWGLDNVALLGDVRPAVPEPGTWALLAAGLLGVGAAARRNRA